MLKGNLDSPMTAFAANAAMEDIVDFTDMEERELLEKNLFNIWMKVKGKQIRIL